MSNQARIINRCSCAVNTGAKCSSRYPSVFFLVYPHMAHSIAAWAAAHSFVGEVPLLSPWSRPLGSLMERNPLNLFLFFLSFRCSYVLSYFGFCSSVWSCISFLFSIYKISRFRKEKKCSSRLRNAQRWRGRAIDLTSKFDS